MTITTPKTTPWKCRDRIVMCGERTLLMGVLNVTPDSFSDGGAHVTTQSAIDYAKRMLEDGADIIDIGGESTRPGAMPVDASEEAKRVIPVIERLASETDCLLSVDTMKAEVAQQAMQAGARIINDVSAFEHDNNMLHVALQHQPGIILMHMKGMPSNMQDNPQYTDVVSEVRHYLEARMQVLAEAGIPLENIALDPGIGFGKTLEHNLALLKRLNCLAELDRPILVGASRKSFISLLTKRSIDERLAGSLAALSSAIERGAHILRVHDIKESCDAARVVDSIRSGNTQKNT